MLVFMHVTQFMRVYAHRMHRVSFLVHLLLVIPSILYLYSPDTQRSSDFLRCLRAKFRCRTQDFFPLTLLARFKFARYNGRANAQGWLQPFQTKWPRAIRHRLFQKSFQINFSTQKILLGKKFVLFK